VCVLHFGCGVNGLGTGAPFQNIVAIATESSWFIDDELLHKLEDTARAQSRIPSDVISEAVGKYLDEQSWIQFVENNGARARAHGISEEDVDRLISEARAECRLRL
jgi:predicted transcriptional regulator